MKEREMELGRFYEHLRRLGPKGEARAASAFLFEGETPERALELGRVADRMERLRHPTLSLDSYAYSPDSDVTLADTLPDDFALVFDLAELKSDLEQAALRLPGKLSRPTRLAIAKAAALIAEGAASSCDEALSLSGLIPNRTRRAALREIVLCVL
jgi:hypothetical protein